MHEKLTLFVSVAGAFRILSVRLGWKGSSQRDQANYGKWYFFIRSGFSSCSMRVSTTTSQYKLNPRKGALGSKSNLRQTEHRYQQRANLTVAHIE